ncbi:tRNA (guanine-N1)-methyltransferase [Aestuariibaculum marinum]|uniref:tRNA (Guanine-N1)-methyltransferase n=1 Tax=Aestuariibaculum marinum TaxID=2683592 RepID=A0A8J6U7K7_9FLAO|nr:tRNA (guanine-N1)-methyltransferase [Aestuariibaculum marinum]MBD0823136.1 tRNA (guanine-N1)-methyltransferase [Aestuariibaculum marinum]
MNKIKYLAVFSFLFTATVFAQTENDEEKLSLNSGTIDNQFEYVIQRSNNYQDYKVIKKVWLYALKAHTMDSLNAVHKNLNDTKAVVNTQAKEIDNLKASLTETQDTLDATNLEKDSMSLFGIQMSKGSYNFLMWSIIGGLLALLLLFIYKFKNSNVITTEARKALSEIEEEFEEHRKIALEREQKVRRQLQDEINKHKKI